MKEILLNPHEILKEIQSIEIQSVNDKLNFQEKFAGKDGLLPRLIKTFRELSAEEKKVLGKNLNLIKDAIESKIKSFKEKKEYYEPVLDISRKIKIFDQGFNHPLMEVTEEVCRIFGSLGFVVVDGPEVESEYFNFSALNFPEDHPARDMQDTFFLSVSGDGTVLRTHTSPVQIRQMLNGSPPFRILAPGKVFRCDHDSTHSPVFHQIEGLYVDRHVSFSDLRINLEFFAKAFFGSEIGIRFRPSFFPFTEPSAEMDIFWDAENKWLEILGCGMVHPQVLENCHIDSKKWWGFAFGLGVERLAMIKFGIRDIRLFYENHLMFLTPQMN
ncbi:MAG: phenylalanine--tRNA ligase subunit alpha [Flavobacteriales bacterium]|nr:phenylalanine--tRNA ligase subunit alpha [Flavobacteriales bacterium]